MKKKIKLSLSCLPISKGGVEDTRLEAKDSPSEDRYSGGQGQECSRPRAKDTGAFFPKKKIFKIFFRQSQKKSFQKFFRRSPKKRCRKKFLADLQNFNHSKNSAVLEPRTGQFLRTRGFEAKDLTFEAKAKDIKMCPQGLHHCQ